MCPNQDTIIDGEDLLIFIGPKSNPVHNFEMVGTFTKYVDEARAISKKYPEIEVNRLSNGATNSKILTNLLVCGWRPVWQEHPERLYARMMEVVSQRLPGSTISFLNSVDPDDFTVLMLSNGLTRVADNGPNRVYEMHAPHKGIYIRHIKGDAASAAVLSPVIMECKQK